MLNPFVENIHNACEWFAIRTKSRYEKAVVSSLKAKEHQVLLPLYRDTRQWGGRTSEVELPLFSGYVFARFDPRRRLPILQTPGVVQIVGTRDGPVPMDESEVLNLTRIIESDVPAKPWPFLSAGQLVEIDRGPLKDVRGIFISYKAGNRLIVSVTLLQRAIGVQVDVGSVRPILSRPPQTALISLPTKVTFA